MHSMRLYNIYSIIIRMFNVFKNFFDDNKKRINSYSKIIEEINGYEKTISKLSDTKLKAKTAYFKELLAKGNTLDHIYPRLCSCS
jgi:preprotein translocase subunit SecA